MKDKELKVDEIESSHTLGGVGTGRVQGRGTWRGWTCLSVADRYTTAIFNQARGLAFIEGRRR